MGVRILGLDPGSRITGYGLVEVTGNAGRHVASGCIRPGDGALSDRLAAIYEAVAALIGEHAPEEVAVEQVFVHRNPDSALKLGQARGAAILAAGRAGLPLAEYSPRAIKQAIVGKGGAGKDQIQYMVRMLLGLRTPLQADAADALAAALCHAHTRQTLSRRLTGLGVGE